MSRDKDYGKKYYQKHKARRLAAAKAWSLANPEQYKERYRNRNLKKYGFTSELFDERKRNQHGLCAICRVVLVSGKQKAAACADHDHASGKPRGILCSRCNLLLGHAGDSIGLLMSAIDYLEYWNGTTR